MLSFREYLREADGDKLFNICKLLSNSFRRLLKKLRSFFKQIKKIFL